MKNNWLTMLVSVIIPTFGDPLYLESAINSVLNQTLENFELIIVDDNDPNTMERQKTEKLVSTFLLNDFRIKYIKHDKNRNGAVARNTGFSVATGKYIALLDSDDEYLSSRLEKCYNIMENAPDEIGGVYTGCEFRKRGKKYFVKKNVMPGNFMIETLASSFMFCTGSNFFMRKSIIDELNGFDESFHRHQDYEFLVRFFVKYSLYAIDEVLVIKNNENFNVPSVEKLIEIKKQYLNKYKYLIDNLSLKEQNYIYHTQYVLIAETALRNKKNDTSRNYYRKSIKFGNLTSKEKYRKLAFTLLNLID